MQPTGQKDSGKTPTNTSPNRCHGERKENGVRFHDVDVLMVKMSRSLEVKQGSRGLYLKVERRISSQSQFEGSGFCCTFGQVQSFHQEES